MDSPHDYPDAVDLGLEPDSLDPDPVTEPCGCAIYPGEPHDVAACLEEQAEALQDDERTRAERRAGWIAP